MSIKCKSDIEYNLVYSLVLRPLDRTRKLEQQEIIDALMAGEDSEEYGTTGICKISEIKVFYPDYVSMVVQTGPDESLENVIRNIRYESSWLLNDDPDDDFWDDNYFTGTLDSPQEFCVVQSKYCKDIKCSKVHRDK